MSVSTLAPFCLGYRGLVSKRKSTCPQGDSPVTSDMTGNCLKQCTLLSHTVLMIDDLTINPLMICLDPRWIPLGKCAPTVAEKCALDIPPSELADMGLKLSSLGSSKMGWKDFLGSNLIISRESQMHPLQLLHPQWLSNVPKMISPSEFDEEPRNRYALPSSQLGRKGITGFSLTGTSRTSLMLSSCALYLDKCTLTIVKLGQSVDHHIDAILTLNLG
jgi:hypothetical protein